MRTIKATLVMLATVAIAAIIAVFAAPAGPAQAGSEFIQVTPVTAAP
jgi:hypothetical protein